ncbi:MAG TPA: TlpA disulfide reductase family protein [Rhizomicrobium sp.]|nr:TlpA disulfide reductase family protein [Rhizomicrobium sp.]
MHFQLPTALALPAVLILGANSAATAGVPARLSEGSLAPEFTRNDTRGGLFSLRGLHGRIVLIDFWASWCTPCLLEIPDLIQLQRQFGPLGLRIVGISMDESEARLRRAMGRYPFNYRVVVGDPKLAELYGGIYGLPTQFLVGPDGRVLHAWTEEVSPFVLKGAIRDAMRPPLNRPATRSELR